MTIFALLKHMTKLQTLIWLFAKHIKPLLALQPNALKLLRQQTHLQSRFQLRPTQQAAAALPSWLALLAVPKTLLSCVPLPYLHWSSSATQVVQLLVIIPHLF